MPLCNTFNIPRISYKNHMFEQLALLYREKKKIEPKRQKFMLNYQQRSLLATSPLNPRNYLDIIEIRETLQSNQHLFVHDMSVANVKIAKCFNANQLFNEMCIGADCFCIYVGYRNQLKVFSHHLNLIAEFELDKKHFYNNRFLIIDTDIMFFSEIDHILYKLEFEHGSVQTVCLNVKASSCARSSSCIIDQMLVFLDEKHHLKAYADHEIIDLQTQADHVIGFNEQLFIVQNNTVLRCRLQQGKIICTQLASQFFQKLDFGYQKTDDCFWLRFAAERFLPLQMCTPGAVPIQDFAPKPRLVLGFRFEIEGGEFQFLEEFLQLVPKTAVEFLCGRSYEVMQSFRVLGELEYGGIMKEMLSIPVAKNYFCVLMGQRFVQLGDEVECGEIGEQEEEVTETE